MQSGASQSVWPSGARSGVTCCQPSCGSMHWIHYHVRPHWVMGSCSIYDGLHEHRPYLSVILGTDRQLNASACTCISLFV